MNIAWDANVPPPPEGSEEAIQKAMTGEEPDVDDEEQWFVPVVVSEPRSAVDKGEHRAAFPFLLDGPPMTFIHDSVRKRYLIS